MPPYQNQPPQNPQNQLPTPGPQPDPSGQPGQDPYGFFMEPPKPQKPSLLGGNSIKQKILLFGGAAVILILILTVVAALMSGNKQEPLALLAVAQRQQEVIRLAEHGMKNTKVTTLQNFATTTKVSVTSAQKAVLAELQRQGVKPKTKVLEMSKNVQTDQAFQTAIAANTYDTTFASTMQTELDTYHARLEDAASVAVTKTELAILQKQIKDTELLQKQLLAR